ncbi:LytR/AlgR family response regulator transcription factor [Diplocloster agilis]|uniref:LytR/AlgR family response regulator transcription factor n=1 Tax=Diplocloster agilis TaxID=2850323 RepID=UPI0008216B80|nr:LytTR family DNA-binding domain-containing protein [Suonthocola fibrivorans]MCU6734227.1 LytTR family DNA-binding domain-containing protein [Suonthocola fibrivorans]SCJ29381.1 putative two-component response-regulatory protein YehT [uncultured Clostridium sp.]
MVKIAVYDQRTDVVNRILCTLRLRYGYRVAARGFTDLESFREGLLLQWPPDIAVLNIAVDMDACIGTAKKIQDAYGRIPFIFLMESYCELAKVFQVNTAACLKLPLQPVKMTAAVDHLMNEKKERDREVLLVKNQSGMELIPCEEIWSIGSCRHTVTVYGQKNIWKCYGKLDEMMERLPWYFLRCHQSWIVNMEKLKEVQNSYIEMDSAKRIPVSRNRCKTVRKFAEENFENMLENQEDKRIRICVSESEKAAHE